MTDKKDPPRPPAAPPGSNSAIDAFLAKARSLEPLRPGTHAARLVFALDATMSRQPTWDLACRIQAEMFDAVGRSGELAVQLVYFRGFGECRSSRWVADASALTSLMTRIDCRGGRTQIGRVLRHVRSEAARNPLKVLIYVGDAMEESTDDLCALAGELGLLGIKAFMFHEGHDPNAAGAFQEIARLTGGAYARFDTRAPQVLADLLRAAAVYAAHGLDGLAQLAPSSEQARRLLTAMTGKAS